MIMLIFSINHNESLSEIFVFLMVQIICSCIRLVRPCYFRVMEHLLGTEVGNGFLVVFIEHLIPVEMLSGAGQSWFVK